MLAHLRFVKFHLPKMNRNLDDPVYFYPHRAIKLSEMNYKIPDIVQHLEVYSILKRL